MDTRNGTAPGLDLEPVARQVRELLGSVDDRQLAGPTPCPAYSVRELLGHLLGLTVAFRDAGRKELGPTTGTSPGSALPVLPGDWRETMPPLLDELVAAWRSPDALEGMTQAGGVDLPGRIAGAVARNELLVHGWDLARATGQEFRADEESLRASEVMLAPGDDDRSGPDAIFGPPVPVPPGAPLLDRVIALSGRRPDWRPDGGPGAPGGGTAGISS
ncbi:TIGR03086 family metal-binding protein [Streptomyces sp. NBC_00059]|uniref:TIGR03086 family metal-binding protein n=1 Tax=Streptomyces sp. NBC_00059 TaxID=2975635 RepID=UPI00225C40AB|nr:TIGR03086 family metal-binding protein [Streptomyces sp. NBC_00059]MCX5417559.1 TIGR03086 family metal-binding protein [Streptomyces sp. NBC_00059]